MHLKLYTYVEELRAPRVPFAGERRAFSSRSVGAAANATATAVISLPHVIIL